MTDLTITTTTAATDPSAARRWPWIAFGALTCAAITIVVIRGAAQSRWQAALARAEAFRLRIETMPRERAALYGATEAGAAWAAYTLAATTLPNKPEMPWAKLAADPSAAGATAWATALEAWAPAFAELTRGAHRRDATFAVDWSKGTNIPNLHAREFVALADAAVASAQLLRRRGDSAAAALRLLDTLQLARDLCGSPVLIHAAVGATILTDRLRPTLFADDTIHEFDAPARRALSEGFARALAGWPADLTWGADALLSLRDFELLPTWEVATSLPLPTWRHAFSHRLAAADHALAALDFAEAMSSGAPWSQVPQHARVPPPGYRLGPPTTSVAKSMREAVADLHAMTAALAWCDGESVDPTHDGPCGSRIERRETTAEVVFASTGAAPGERIVRLPRSTRQRPDK